MTLIEATKNDSPLILILALSDLHRDPRLMRQIRWLKDDFNVLSAGYSPSQITDVQFINISYVEPIQEVAITKEVAITREVATTQAVAVTQEEAGIIANASVLALLARFYFRVRALALGFPILKFFLSKIKFLAGRIYYKVRSLAGRIYYKVRSLAGRIYYKVRSLAGRIYYKVRSMEFIFVGSSAEKCINLNYFEYYKDKLNRSCDISALKTLSPDLILANDLDCLVLANLLFPNSKIVFDAHEYAPLEYNHTSDSWLKLEQPARVWACKTFLPKVFGMSTVCEGIATEFVKNFDIPCPVKVVTNAPFFEDISPRVAGDRIKIVHHGIGSPLRNLELMADAIKLLGNKWELNFILVNGDPLYIAQLKERYRDCDNIIFLEPVPMPDISKFISQFDIGIFILEPYIFNYQFALPNKFFEFIQARLAIAIGPSPEMSRIVINNDLGVVSPDFSSESMAKSLEGITKEDLQRYKINAHSAATIHCAETNKDLMKNIINCALSSQANMKAV